MTHVPMTVPWIRAKAILWAEANGLKGKLIARVEEHEYGFSVLVSEEEGKKRSANCVFTKEGQPSLYEANFH